MTHISLIKGIGNLLFTASTTIVLIFISFLLRKSEAEVLGLPIQSRTVHAVLGSFLILVNACLVVYLIALYASDLGKDQIREIQSYQVKYVLGPLLNPFYLSKSTFINSIGYAFLIILWWLAMHSLTYSINLNQRTPLLFGWQALISVLFFVLGLMSMLAIQGCWAKWGLEAYRWKLNLAFVGIGIGGFLPPILLKLGLPEVLTRFIK